MMQTAAVAMVLGAVLAAAPMAPATAKAASPTATHTMKGVVKSIDSTTLVVERGSSKHKQHLTFALDSSTHRDGDIAVGSTVSVRYRTEAKKLLALNVEPAKAAGVVRKTSAR